MITPTKLGSQITISFQAKYPTFSSADFDKIMIDLGFQRNSNQNQTGQQYFYTKNNITIEEISINQTVNFQFLNEINISELYDKIKNILLHLKINPTTIHIMMLDCKTMVHGIDNPENTLTMLISDQAKEKIEKSLKIKPAVYSLVLVNQDPQEEDLQIRIEPLATNPKESFYIHIKYSTKLHDKFDSFITEFNEDKIRNIINSVMHK